MTAPQALVDAVQARHVRLTNLGVHHNRPRHDRWRSTCDVCLVLDALRYAKADGAKHALAQVRAALEAMPTPVGSWQVLGRDAVLAALDDAIKDVDQVTR